MKIQLLFLDDDPALLNLALCLPEHVEVITENNSPHEIESLKEPTVDFLVWLFNLSYDTLRWPDLVVIGHNDNVGLILAQNIDRDAKKNCIIVSDTELSAETKEKYGNRHCSVFKSRVELALELKKRLMLE